MPSWKASYAYLATVLILFHAVPGLCSSPIENVQPIKLSGVQVRAFASAFAEFRKTGYAIENYTVTIEKGSRGWEVSFVPNHPEGKPTTRGGRTIYGEEMRYLISESGSILSIGFSK